MVVVVCDSGDEYLGDATPCDACGPAVVLLVAGVLGVGHAAEVPSGRPVIQWRV